MRSAEGYRIVAQLGIGREGARYRGEKPESQQSVLLHFLRPARVDGERMAEITDRARCLGRIDTAGIAPVLEGRFLGQRPFVAVTWDSNSFLSERLARGHLARKDAARFGLEIVRTLRRAHQRGLFHGGLSASSVGIDENGHVLLDLMAVETLEHESSNAESGPSFENDIHDLANLMLGLTTGKRGHAAIGELGAPDPVSATFEAMLSTDPWARPTIGEVVRILAPWLEADAPGTGASSLVGVLDASIGADPTIKADKARIASPLHASGERAVFGPGAMLSRYKIETLLGHGSMGEVYRANELGTSRPVALKVLKRSYQGEELVLRRFRREAKMLDQVRHENVANLIEVNESDGILFMALEFIDGPSLLDYRRDKPKLDEKEALYIMAQIARGLINAHARGVVHRDLKPGNVLLEKAEGHLPFPYRVKVCDFGIAKWVQEDAAQTDLTQDNALGTPKYMSPEQCSPGQIVTPASDIYALGATLFDLVSGRAPFNGSTTAAILYAHVYEAPERLEAVAPEISPGVCKLVARMLAKDPAGRPRDAAELLAEIEALLGAPPAFAHPALPAGADVDNVMMVAHRWELPSPPEAIWPRVSNTERLNRAIGLPPVTWSVKPSAEGGSKVFGEARQLGLSVKWREHPFEWIEGQKLGVLREYAAGPLVWYVSAVEIQPTESGGSVLTHKLWLQPRNALYKAAAWVETKQRLKRRMEIVYRRIGAVSAGRDDVMVDPFEPEGGTGSRLARIQDAASKVVGDKVAIEPLLRFLASAPDQEVARIRPKALARRLGVNEGAMITACLNGATQGLLVPLWDVICPTCRIPANVTDSLKAIAAHGFCEACNLGFQVDLSSSVELIFRVHPQIRAAEVRTYCIGGPVHSPHAAVQLRLQAGERFSVSLNLEVGPYELRVVGEGGGVPFRVEASGPSRAEVELGGAMPKVLGAGPITIVLHNAGAKERVVRVERSAPRDDAFTAAEAGANPLFRRLFPDQTFKPDELISMASITLLITDLAQPERLYADLGDAKMLSVLHQLLQRLSNIVELNGGALVKAAGHGVVAAFAKVEDAVTAGLAAVELGAARGEGEAARELPIVAAVHKGAAMAATVNERLDYFGRSVTRAHRLVELAAPGELILSDEVAEDRVVESIWRGGKAEADVLTVAPAGDDIEFALRLRVRPAAAG